MNSTDLLPPEIVEEDLLLDSTAQLEESARALDLEDWIVQRLKHPQREVTINLPLRRDSGDALTCAALRVQHYHPRAGCLGQVVLAPDAHFAQLRPLALQMTLQSALLDLPLGGSAGAIVCDPAQLSERELRHLVRDYVAALDLHGDIFAPAEFAAAWTAASRHLEPAALVGKPAILGGLPDPAAALATGWSTLIFESLRAQKSAARSPAPLTTSYQPPFSLDGCRVALQGFGPAAAALANLLHNAGARIIALADKSGGLFAERGLDLAAVANHLTAHGMLYGFDGAEAVRNSEVLESACDVLVAAAAERQVNCQNASRIRAALLLETLPNAITPSAEPLLTSRGITIIPALLGAAPRMLAWFAEWQNGLHYAAPEQAATESLIRHKLTQILHRAQASAASHKLSLSGACRRLALEKLAAKLRLTQ
jgi:glutamate dehydrogenase (NAD(P)+)